jgi:hypothetical protein
MIYKGRGLLIDWDMCKRLDGEHANEARQSERTVRFSAEKVTLSLSNRSYSHVGHLAVHVCRAIDGRITIPHSGR